ncbi:Der GTPase-activating protein YihI [Ferrimonas senticii]|uniref:Der GTPase-activating protein YihI n=1 Tax=Ferrimonas senticii TaxID=394566 RepID=UPI000428AB6B|nr:Der GTPase-activating protein YihI [Ferrimonas senticii]
MTRAKKTRKVNANGPARPPRAKRDESFKTGKRKGKGQASGNRHSSTEVRTAANTKADKVDPRHGSKKKIALVIEPTQAPVVTKLSPEKELAKLENNPRLGALLDKVEGGELLAPADQFWLDTTLARIAVLMDELGIDDDAYDDEPVAAPSKAQGATDELDLLAQFEQGASLLDQYKD